MKPPYNKALLKTEQFTAVTKLSHIIRKLPAEFSVRPKDLIVGGFVRDLLFGSESLDIDVEVYGVSIETLDAVLRSYFSQGKITQVKAFALWNIEHKGHAYTYSLPREEHKSSSGHRGFIINAQPTLGKKKAVLRRDFTINALLLDPLTQTIYDYTGGISDIEQHILKAVHTASLKEDPVRAWRAIQLVGRFNLCIEQATGTAFSAMAQSEEVRLLSGGRVRLELDKLLGKSKKPSQGLILAHRWRLLPQHLPEIASKAINKKWWSMFMQNLDAASDDNEDVQLRARWLYILNCISASEQQALISRLGIPKKFRK